MDTNEIDIGLVADSGLGIGSELPLGCTAPPDSFYEFIPASDEAVARLRREFGLDPEPNDL